MRQKLLAFLAVCAISQTAYATPDNFSLTIKNNSSWDIYHIYVSSSNDPDWGSDLLGRRVLGNGSQHTITNVSFGQWDLKFVDEDGDVCILNKIQVTRNLSWTLTNRWLLDCENRNR